MGWETGDLVVYRQVHAAPRPLDGAGVTKRPWCVLPARVVEDSDERVVLWWPSGTRYLRPVFGDRIEALRRQVDGTWELAPTDWWGGDSLQVIPRGAPFALWPFRLEQGDDLLGWYCNLQRPLVRTYHGFDTMDWTLDVWAEPDLSSWQWKDAHELEAGEEMGLYSPTEVERIRAAGERVIELIEGRSSLFDGWAGWSPPSDWTAPELPGGVEAL